MDPKDFTLNGPIISTTKRNLNSFPHTKVFKFTLTFKIMIDFHSERNINFSEILPIILKRNRNLEQSLKKIFPEKCVTVTNYGRTAFQLILEKHGLRDCKIMIPAFICSVFYDIFKKNNITPILIDVEIDTFNISPRTLKKGFDISAKALITNNMNGLPCEIEDIKRILTKDQILIEDCAHSLGAYHNKKPVGTSGESAFFSLYKNLPTISGGFAITKQPVGQMKRERINFETIKKLFYYLGKVSNFYKSFKTDNGLYENELIYKKVCLCSPNKIVEKLASFYVKKIDKIIKSRKKIAKILISNLKQSNLSFQKNKKNEHVYTYFSFLLPKTLSGKRNKFLKELRKNKVVGRIVWNKPLSSLYNNRCKNTLEISKRIVGIPINPNYSKKDADELAKRVLLSLKKI